MVRHHDVWGHVPQFVRAGHVAVAVSRDKPPSDGLVPWGDAQFANGVDFGRVKRDAVCDGVAHVARRGAPPLPCCLGPLEQNTLGSVTT